MYEVWNEVAFHINMKPLRSNCFLLAFIVSMMLHKGTWNKLRLYSKSYPRTISRHAHLSGRVFTRFLKNGFRISFTTV